jgi:F-type H+-transporting ATPase subunit delta
MSETAAPDVAGTVFDEVASDLARTYADALLNAADADGEMDAVVEELQELVDDVWTAQPNLASFLTSSTSQEARDAVIVKVFEGRALPTVTKFLRVLNRHDRLGLLPRIALEARSRFEVRRNRIAVAVRSAVPLEEHERSALTERLALLTGVTPVVRFEVNPDLIGGLVVQIGDDVFDASLRNRLNQLRRRLFEGKSHELQARREEFLTLS